MFAYGRGGQFHWILSLFSRFGGFWRGAVMLRTVSCKYTSTPRIGDCFIIMSITSISLGLYAFGIVGGRLERVRLVDLNPCSWGTANLAHLHS